MIYVGMDVHKRTTTFCAIDDAGKIAGRGKVDSGEDGWFSIIERWPIDQIRVVLETGGMTWWVVDARQFKMIADSKKKSDRRDARTLAEALKGGLAQNCSVVVPSERAPRGRSLMQIREMVVKQSVLAMQAARSLLRSVGVSITRSEWSKEPS